MNIEYWRSEIDEIDRELLRLLNRRARLAIKVGALKRVAGLPYGDPDREQVVLSTLQQSNTGPLDSRAVTRLFRRIIGESRRVETQMATPEGGERARGQGEARAIASDSAQGAQGFSAREALL